MIKRIQCRKIPRGLRVGFSLVEVIIAIGVLSVAVVAMLGMLAPTMDNVRSSSDKNQAIVTKDAINIYLSQQVTFANVATWLNTLDGTGVSTTHLYVIPYDNANYGGKSLIDASSNTSYSFPTSVKDDMEGINGSFFRVDLRPLASGYSYASAASNSYIPFVIEIYAVSPFNPGPTSDDVAVGDFLLSYSFVLNQ